jgi:tRNA (guanine37-N1)-methyltransferase
VRSPALVVPRERGETTRRELLRRGLLRRDLLIAAGDREVAFPIPPGSDPAVEGARLEEREFRPARERPPADYRELLPWSAAERALLPRSFDVVGDLVLVRLPPELVDRRREIGDALLRFVPHCRLVGWDQGVHGADRRRRLEAIAGGGSWATRHRENGLLLDVNPEEAYFSPRLAREHARVATEVRRGESVYDLCCGVGPFSIAIARDGRARSIVAVDANPEAIRLLRGTLARYPFGPRVEAVEDRIERFLLDRTAADRVILNLPHEGIKYAPSVAERVALRGHLHYYEIVARAERERRASVISSALGPAGAWSCRAERVLHPYSPDADLVGFDFERGTA